MLQTIALAVLVVWATRSGPKQVSAPFIGGSRLSDQVFQDVNRYRRDRGAPELLRHAELDELAMSRCEFFRKNRHHPDLRGKSRNRDGFEGHGLVTLKSLVMLATCENVASTTMGASDMQTSGFLVKIWLESPIQEQAMRNPAWTHTGIGTVADSDGCVFTVQIFSNISHSQLMRQGRFSDF